MSPETKVYDAKMQKTIEVVKANFASVRAGRANAAIKRQKDGRGIRLGFPQLTAERRRDLTKQVHKYGAEGKVALRNIRREAMDEIKKQVKKSEITEDDQKQLEKELQDLTDKRCKEVDELTAKKEQELMAV